MLVPELKCTYVQLLNLTCKTLEKLETLNTDSFTAVL